MERNTPAFDLVGSSENFHRILKLASVLAKHRHHAMIVGERGCGKERIARQIHQQSPHWQGPFVVLACRELNEEQLTEMFCEHSKNILLRAHQGTLFIEDPQYLPKLAQEVLLNAIINQKWHTNDRYEAEPLDLRVFVALQREDMELAKIHLLPELYFRLKQFLLEIPALRERPEDVGALAHTFVRQFAAQTGRNKQLSKTVLERLTHHSWPENIGELKKVIYHACEHAAQVMVHEDSLPPEYHDHDKAEISLDEVGDLDELERRMYTHVFKRCGCDPRKTAEKLGIGLSTFYRKMRQYALAKNG